MAKITVNGFVGVLLVALSIFSLVTAEGRLWPDYSCHPNFKEGTMQYKRLQCEETIGKENYWHKTMKGCMMHSLGIITGTHSEPTVQPYWEDGKRFQKNLEKVVGKSKAAELFNNLASCEETFKEIVTDGKKPEAEWDPLFHCVENASGC